MMDPSNYDWAVPIPSSAAIIMQSDGIRTAADLPKYDVTVVPVE